MKTKKISGCDWLQIAAKDAKALNGGRLPRPGHEALVQHEGRHYWLARTMVSGKQVWSIRPTPWRLNAKGTAFLGEAGIEEERQRSLAARRKRHGQYVRV